MSESRTSAEGGLQWFNSLPDEIAAGEILQCCGARVWASRVVAKRPFASVAELKARAKETWRSLTRDDWLEAFRAHPKIGERKAAQKVSAQASAWSSQEQSGVDENDQNLQKLLVLNNEYERKFGYIFIVCATGKSTSEILQILQRRLANDPAHEIEEAASEQEKITELRLEKLLVQH